MSVTTDQNFFDIKFKLTIYLLISMYTNNDKPIPGFFGSLTEGGGFLLLKI